jgi:hypothetical protein
MIGSIHQNVQCENGVTSPVTNAFEIIAIHLKKITGDNNSIFS